MTITDKANAFRRAMDPEVLAELVRLEVGGNPRPGQTRAKTEPHDTSRAVDFDRVQWALDNPLLPVPETLQSALGIDQ